MNEIIKTVLLKLVCAAIVVVGAAFATCAQTATTTTVVAGQTTVNGQQQRKQVTTTAKSTPVIVENKPAAPQVVTILHRLTGVELLDMLMSKESMETIVKLDPSFQLAKEVHTNVVAGVALNAGDIIAAWLPEARVALPAPVVKVKPRTPSATPPNTPVPDAPPAPPAPFINFPQNFPGNLIRTSDLNVITGDGKRVVARYIGIDGLTGLSLIAMPNGRLSHANDAKNDQIVVGQRIRIIAPQPALDVEPNTKGPMYIRIGETEAIVVNVTRSPSGGIARVKIKCPKFSASNIGGIAINDALSSTLGS